MGRAEDIKELQALSNDPGVPEEVKAKIIDKLWALADTPAPPTGATIDQPPNPGDPNALGGVQAAYGKDWTPYGRGGQPIEQTEGDVARDEAAMSAEADRVASMLDPRFPIVPQVLALQPATNHPGGEKAAQAAVEAGQKPWVIYEPTIDSVRRHLYANPALMRTISPDHVPTAQEIQNLKHDSPLYRATADWMYKEVDKVASEKGVPIVRYSQSPWYKFDGADPEAANAVQAFVLGVDDTATLGIGRTNQELMEPTNTLTQQTRMGVNASVPHPSREVNAWTEEEYPLSYRAGQVLGALHPRSIGGRLWEMLETGSLAARAGAAKALGGTALGKAVGEFIAPQLKTAAGVAADAATGGVAAGATQAAQEAVDVASRGSLPDLSEASERVKDAGTYGAAFAGGGSAVRRGSGYGAEKIRDTTRFSDQYGRGLVRQAEPNLEWGPMSVLFGTRPNKATRELVAKSSKTGWVPTDTLADEMAGPVGRAAADNSRLSADRAAAARAGYHVSPEGLEQVPVRQALDEALRATDAHYQPQGNRPRRAINDQPPPSQKVFNALVGDVSLAKSERATRLTGDQAGAFLNRRAQAKLLKDDIERVARENIPPEEIGRADYLEAWSPKARARVNEEIEADIDDLLGFDTEGVPRTVSRNGDEYKAAEQYVLRERVAQEMLLEPFQGSFAEYLKTRGIDAVYVTPRALDAKRLDQLIELHGADSALGRAAAFDRRQFSAGGKKGGYSEMLGQQEDEAARHAKIAEEVAPGGEAFKTIAGLYQAHPGQGQLVDKVKALAEQAGVSPTLERMRGQQATVALANRARAADRFGHPRAGGRINPVNYGDMWQLRAFPVLRALEGPLGPLEGSTLGRVGLVGGRETKEETARAQAGPRAKYEAWRERRIKANKQEEEDADKERERKRKEPIKRRR